MLTLDDADLASPGGAGDPEAPASTSSTSTATPAPDAPAPAPAGESGWGSSAAGAKVAAWAAGESSPHWQSRPPFPEGTSLPTTTRFGD